MKKKTITDLSMMWQFNRSGHVSIDKLSPYYASGFIQFYVDNKKCRAPFHMEEKF